MESAYKNCLFLVCVFPRIPKNSYTRNIYSGLKINHKFVKHIFVDNGSDLSTILAFSPDISRASIIVFESFRKHTFRKGLQDHVIRIFKNIFQCFSPINFRKSHKVSLSLIKGFKTYYGKTKDVHLLVPQCK